MFEKENRLAHQALLCMEFSRQEYWRGLPFPSPGDLPDPGIKPRSSALQADSLPSEPPGKVGGKNQGEARELNKDLESKVCHANKLELDSASREKSSKI